MGLRCSVSPISDYSGPLAVAASVAGPSARLSANKVPVFAGLVKKTAAAISSNLGFGSVDTALVGSDGGG